MLYFLVCHDTTKSVLFNISFILTFIYEYPIYVNMNKAEIIGRMLMVLVGFVIAMLGLIYAIHTQDVYLGILIAVGGVASMLVGLPE